MSNFSLRKETVKGFMSRFVTNVPSFALNIKINFVIFFQEKYLVIAIPQIHTSALFIFIEIRASLNSFMKSGFSLITHTAF